MKVAGENQVLTTMQILFSHGDRTHRWSLRTDRGSRGYGQLLFVGACLLRHRQFLPDGRQLASYTAQLRSQILSCWAESAKPEVAQIVSQHLALQSKTYVIQNRRILVYQLLKSGLDFYTANRTITVLILSLVLQLTNKNQ